MVEIIEIKEPHGIDYYVYAGAKLVRVCPSRGMAEEVAAGYRDLEAERARGG